MPVRLNKYLADRGVCARRKADALIAAGQVMVDGKRAVVGQSVEPERQSIAVGGVPLRAQRAAHVTLVLNKPRGVITTLHDERGRTSVARFLPEDRRLFPIGRLDAESTGVLVCTTDGALAEALAHPSYGVEKHYRVRVAGRPDSAAIAALGATRAKTLGDGTSSFEMVLRGGRNREVRRACAQHGLRVLDLERIRFGPIALGNLKPGATRALTPAERRAVEAIVHAAHPRDDRGVRRATVRPTE